FSFLPVFGLHPSTAMDNAGNAVIAFQTIDHGFGNTSHLAFNIHSIRVSSNGTNDGDRNITFGGNSNPGDNNVEPSVALSPTSGSLVVAWDSIPVNNPGSLETIGVAEVNGSGVITLNGTLPASPTNTRPAVSVNSNGGYLLTHDALNSAGHRDIDGRF